MARTALTFKKDVDEIKKMEPGKRRNYHDDISIAVIDLRVGK